MTDSHVPRLGAATAVLGFFVCHVVFEALNEALVTMSEVPTSITLWSVFLQFAFCALLPLLLPRSQQHWVLAGSLHSWKPFLAISMMVFLSNSLSQYSTHYVEFSLKIVAKSSKLMPTMAISGLLGNSRNYEALDYLAALLLCVGTALFSSGGSKASTSTSSAQAVLGSVALFLSCIFDGLVPNLQQRVLQEASPEELMVRSNLLGALTGVLGIALSGDASDVLAYAGARPSVVLLLLGIGLSLAGSVRFYTSLVSSHGSVLAVAVGTLRKSCSLLLSYLLFPGKSFDHRRQAGVMCLACGLLLAERRAGSVKDQVWRRGFLAVPEGIRGLLRSPKVEDEATDRLKAEENQHDR